MWPLTHGVDGNDANRVYNWRAAIRRVQVVRPNPLPVLDAVDAMQNTLTPKVGSRIANPATAAPSVSTPVVSRAVVAAEAPASPPVGRTRSAGAAAAPAMKPVRAERPERDGANGDDDDDDDDDGADGGGMGELVTEGVAFSESFHVDEGAIHTYSRSRVYCLFGELLLTAWHTDPDTVKVAAAAARGNVCPICRGDFFSADEMVAHLKIGCKPSAAPVVHVERAEAEPDDDDGADDGAPKTAADRFLKVHDGRSRCVSVWMGSDLALQKARSHVRRLSNNKAPGSPAAARHGGDREMVIGAPTDVTHGKLSRGCVCVCVCVCVCLCLATLQTRRQTPRAT